MNKAVQELISKEVDSWIEESALPVRSNIKPIKMFDGLYPEGDELEAYWDFIHWAMNREHQVLLAIPVKDEESYFVPFELDEHGNDISAFNTMDFKRLRDFKFNYEYWKLKGQMDRLFDLAQTHSCLSNEQGRVNIKKRFDEIVRVEFKEKLERTGQAKYMIRLQEAETIWQKTACET